MPSSFRERLRRAGERLPSLPDRLAPAHDAAPTDLLDRYWYVWVGGIVAALQIHVTLRLRDGLRATERVVLGDSVIFEFIGLHLARGGELYRTIWEVKPPVAFELAWLLATVAPGTYAYHALAIGLNVAAITVGAVAAAGIVREVTDDSLGMLVAALAPFVLPRFWWRATLGLKAKYLVAGFALLALYFHARDREVGSGVASALAVGTWQLAVVVPVATFAATVARRDRQVTERYLAALLGTGLLVALPVLWWGTLPEMVVETVFVPLLGTEDGGDTAPVARVVRGLGIALPVVLLGCYGLVAALRTDRETRRTVAPVAAVAAWFLLALLFVDYDTKNDLIPFVAVVGVGTGLVVGRSGRALRGAVDDPELRATARRAVAVLVCGMALVSVLTFGGYGTGSTGLPDVEVYDTQERVEMEMPYNLTERQQLYWNELEAPTCRVFVGRTQFELVQRLRLAETEGLRYWEPACGQFEPTWLAVREKYGLGVPSEGTADGVFTPTPRPTAEPTSAATFEPSTPPTLTPLPSPSPTLTPLPSPSPAPTATPARNETATAAPTPTDTPAARLPRR